jgi:hypothetical protein
MLRRFQPSGAAFRGGYIPRFVDNVGTAYLTYNDAALAVGTDSDTLEILMLLDDLDGMPAAVTRLLQNSAARLDISVSSGGRVTFIANTSGPVTLVNWQSTNDAAGIIKVAGRRELRFRMELDASPTFELWHRTISGVNTPADWVTMTGAFTTGPTTGTIDIARANQANADLAILATSTGTGIADCKLAHVWMKTGSLQAADAFGAGGAWVDPLTVGTPDLFLGGPIATLLTDKSANAKTFVEVGGPFVDA